MAVMLLPRAHPLGRRREGRADLGAFELDAERRNGARKRALVVAPYPGRAYPVARHDGPQVRLARTVHPFADPAVAEAELAVAVAAARHEHAVGARPERELDEG